MKQIKTWMFAAGMMVPAIAFYAFRPHKADITREGRGFALVELFTSEGCSSCPPAEELAAEIQKESVDKPVYVLAYHVDYWDHQGWKDRYSDPAYSQRQKDYSGWLGTSDIYTPQVVVNGRKELVGSDEPALRSALNNALMATPAAQVTLSARAGESAGLMVSYSLEGGAATDRLLIAVVEKSGVSKVTGGENGGRTLSHVQIVRSLTAVKAASKGTVSVATPAGFVFDPAKWEVVGFVQNAKTGEVYAASRAELHGAGAAGAGAAGTAAAGVAGAAAAGPAGAGTAVGTTAMGRVNGVKAGESTAAAGPVKNVVIVHGAFADASGWEAVYDILKRDGYSVTLVQNPLTSLDADVAATQAALDRVSGPVVLVGHSWAGSVITQAGVSPKVASLVYVAAFVPDSGQSVIDLAKSAPMLAKNGILPPDEHGFVYFSKELFHECFAADLPVAKSDFMYAAQQPIAGACFGAPVTQAAWKTRPVYGIVATEDKAINPALERAMYKHSGAVVTEVKSCHVVFMSHPDVVARVIEEAAKAGSSTAATAAGTSAGSAQ